MWERLRRFGVLISIAGGLTVIGSNVTSWTTAGVMSVLIVVVGAIAIDAWGARKPDASEQVPVEHTSQASIHPRVFDNALSPKEMIASIGDATSIQAKERTRIFIGKTLESVIKVEDVADDRGDNGEKILLITGRDQDEVLIMVRVYDSSWFSIVRALKVGDTISMRGRITTVYSASVWVDALREPYMYTSS